MTEPTRLFLHMGPGLHARVERKILGLDDPLTEYWDQPTDLDSQRAFSDLVAKTTQKIESMYLRLGRPIEIVAHSIGGHIATQVLRSRGDMVASCRFISTAYDVPSGFINLLRLLAQQPDASADFKEKVNGVLDTKKPEPDLNKFWNVIGLITTVPDFMRLYWPSDKLYNSYLHEAATFPPLNFSVFKNVLDDFLLNYFKKPFNLSWNGPITFELGAKDPLMDVEQAVNDWKSLFRQGIFEIRPNSGHFIHLEGKLADRQR